MRAFASLAVRLLPAVAGAGFTAATFQSLAGVVTGVLTALYTAFITIEAGLRVYEKVKARRDARKSPRTKSDE